MVDNSPKDRSANDLDNVIPVTLDDLSEDDRRELHRELEEEMLERQKQKLAGYQKLRNDNIRKIASPNSSAPHVTEVSRPICTEGIAHLIDTSVASKFGTGMTHMAREISDSFTSKLDEFKDQFNKNFENNLPRQVRSIMLQINDEQRGKQPVRLENNCVSLPNTTVPITSASAMLPHTSLNNNQSSQNYIGNSANNFMPAFLNSTVNSTVATSVPPNLSSNNRSVGFNSNFQQPFYQTVAYCTPPLPPTGTGVPYGPVPDAYFNKTPQTTPYSSLPELPPHTHVAPVPQNNFLQPFEAFKDQIASMLREFGLEPKGRARAYQKPYPDYFDSTLYPRGFKIPDFVKFRILVVLIFLILLSSWVRMVDLLLSIWDSFQHNAVKLGHQTFIGRNCFLYLYLVLHSLGLRPLLLILL